MLIGCEISFCDFDRIDAMIVAAHNEDNSRKNIHLNSKYKNASVECKLDMIIPLLETFYGLPAAQKKWENVFILTDNWVYDNTRRLKDIWPMVYEKPATLCPN